MKRLLLLMFVALLGLVACRPSAPTLPADSPPTSKEYRIAYNISMDSTGRNYQVWSMKMDGSDKRNLVNHKEVSWTYHAYGDRIFFISDRDTAYRNYFLYEMDAFGENVRRISDLRLEDSWMSTRNEGKEMVVAGRVGKETRFQLFLIDLESGRFRQLTHDTSAMYRDPAFSPDGKQLVFAYMAHKRDTSADEELWIMNADGSDMRQLTHYPMDDPGRFEYGYKAGPPHWHPTENFISYQSVQGGRSSLYAVTPDGKKQWKLMENKLEEGWHDWSPDGKWLALELYDSLHRQYSIGLMDWATKELKVLTDTSYRLQHSPVFVEVGDSAR
jgi:TolB protein